MTRSDEQIGWNLQRLRGEMTQTALAAEMKKRGHRWSQPTVVAVEKGERPLRYTEAVDLTRILELERLDHLGSDAKSTDMAIAWSALGKAQEALIAASRAYDEARLNFGQTAIVAFEAENSSAGNGVGVLTRTPEMAIERARERRELLEPEALQDVIERLRRLYGEPEATS